MLGIKDLDIEILKRLENTSVIPLISKSFYLLYNDEQFWSTRFFYKFKDHLKDIDVNKFRNRRTWKIYCLEIEKILKSENPYYESAIALEYQRKDILQLLESVKKIKNVVQVFTNDSSYYTRNGKVDGTMEGKMILKGDNWKRIKIFKNHDIISDILFVDNIMRQNDTYIDDKLYKTIKFSKKGAKISKELYPLRDRKEVKTWYVDGKIKSKGVYYDGKRTNVWYHYDKEGNRTEKIY